MAELEPSADPVFDGGMAAHADRLPLSANPHRAETPAHAAWQAGWMTAEARAAETALDGALL